MNTSATSPATSSIRLLWYCHTCQRLILPRGAEGGVDAEGNHYCSGCPAPAAPAGAAARPSAARLRPAEPSAAPAWETIEAGEPEAALAPEAAPAAAVAMRRQRFILYGVGGVLVAGLVVAAVLLLLPQEEPAGGGARADGTGGDRPLEPSVLTADQTPSLPVEPAKKVEPPPPVEKPDQKSVEEPRKNDAPAKGVDEPQKEDEPKQEEPKKDLLPEYQAGLKSAAALAEAGQFSNTLKALDELKTKYSQETWWSQQEPDWQKTRTATNKQLTEYVTEAQESLRQVGESEDPAFLDKIAEAYQAKAQSPDEPVAAPARAILKAVQDGRAKALAQARVREAAKVTRRLEEFEKLLKSRPSPKDVEESTKYLAELEPRLLDDPEFGEKVIEKAAGLRFDLQAARDPDQATFHALLKPRGPATELTYDFSDPAQLRAWTYDRGNDKSSENHAAYDAAKQAVVLHARGEHFWESKERRDMGILRLPFAFRPEAWVFEADVVAVNPKESKDAADYGILVWDGSSNVLRFGVREVKDKVKEFHALVAGSLPGQPDKYAKGFRMPLKVTDTVRLSMAFAQGVVTFNVAPVAAPQSTPARVPPISLRLPLSFAPRYFGLYLRNREKEGSSAALFDNVTLTGIVDREETKKLLAATREATIKSAKGDLHQKLAAIQFAKDEAAGVMDGQWGTKWKLEGKHAKSEQVDHNSRKKVWATSGGQPQNPARWTRQVQLEAGKPLVLRLDAGARPGEHWTFALKVNDQEKFRQEVKGNNWQLIEVPLAEYGGQNVKLELLHVPAGNETAYWDAVRIAPK